MSEITRRPVLVVDTQDAPTIPAAQVRELYRQFEEIENGGGSSNDTAQMLDDWFTANGWPTVMYR